MAATASHNSMNPLPSLIRASSWDAGNQSMRDAGRKVWSREDRYAAAECQERLIRACFARDDDAQPEIAYVRFGLAEAMEKAGLLDLSTKNFHRVLDQAWDDYCAQFEQHVAAEVSQ